MKWIVNYFRKCFCKHEWQYISKTNTHKGSLLFGYKNQEIIVYRCKKCGEIQKIKTFSMKF